MLDMMNEDLEGKIKSTTRRKQDEHFEKTFAKKKNAPKSEVKQMEDKLKDD